MKNRIHIYRRSVGAIALAAGIVITLSACSGSIATPSATESPAPVVVTDAPTNEELAEYFAAIGSADPVEMRRVADALTAPGSNAYAYAIEQGALHQAALDSGFPYESQDIETVEGGFALCAKAASAEDTCAEFTNLTYTEGKLADFDAGGAPLAGRITLGDGQSVPLGDAATVEFLASYRSISGAVWVVVEIRSNIDGLTTPYSSSYVGPDGRQADVGDLVGPRELSAGSLGNFAFGFQGAEFGGVLKLVVYNANYDELTLDIPTS